MVTALIIVNIFLLVFSFSAAKKMIRGKAEKTVSLLSLILFLLTLATIILSLNNYRFRGDYTGLIIGTVFLCSVTVLMAVTSSASIRYSCIIFLFPLLMIDAGLIGPNPLIFPAIVPAFLLDAPVEKISIDKNNDLIIRNGFMIRPLYLRKRAGFLLNREERLWEKEHYHYDKKVENAMLYGKDSLIMEYFFLECFIFHVSG